MHQQSTNAILMIRPAAFGFDPDTAESNVFQKRLDLLPEEIQDLAVAEFDDMVGRLLQEGVDVNVFVDDPLPEKPDAIFPNNWFSTHPDGEVVLYPMESPSRRAERDDAVFDQLAADGWRIDEMLDLSHYERQELFLEGTGSMVIDRLGGKAYACLSSRTHPELLDAISYELDLLPVAFHAEAEGVPVYHTNVMMAIGTGWAVVCAECITDAAERKAVLEGLVVGGRDVVEITLDQMASFAGNMIELRDGEGNPLVVMSQSAHESLTQSQLDRLSAQGKIIPVPGPTIEAIGGGSVRCMIAEVFLPARA